jgi:uncharacterized membrane protein YhaH (DUF805 family)
MDQLKNSFQNDFLFQIKNNYANFYGRAGRREFWTFALWAIAINVVLTVLGAALPLIGVLILLALLLGDLAIVVPSACLSIRRLHDIGVSGWPLLLYPVGLGIAVLVMNVLDSQQGDNKYGPSPKA